MREPSKEALRLPRESAAGPGRWEAHVERNRRYYLVGLSVVYFLATIWRASREKLWFDEIQTLHISQLPSLSAIVNYLQLAVDLNPPLNYLFIAIAGSGEVSARLPAIIGFWVGCAALYLFLRPLVGTLPALTGAMFPCITGGYTHAFEARPYGPLVGLAGCAVLGWQMTEGHRRRLGLVLLACSVSAAVSISSAGVFILIPLVIAQGLRSFLNRRIEGWVWLAFGTALPPFLFLLRIRMAADPALWDGPRNYVYGLLTAYRDLFWPAIPVLVLLLTLILAGGVTRKSVPTHEAVLLIGLALLPFLVAAVTSHFGPFWPRYVVTSILGGAGIVAVLTTRASGILPPLSILLVFVIGLAGTPRRMTGSFPNSSEKIASVLAGIKGPIVCQSTLTFLELDYYHPELSQRLFYITDRSAALRLTGNAYFEVQGYIMKQYLPIRSNIVPYDDFVRNNKTFTLVGATWWQEKKLLEDGAVLEPHLSGDAKYYRVAVSSNTGTWIE